MKKTLFLIITLFAIGSLSAQNSVWNRIDESQVRSEKLARDSNPTAFLLYSLDLNALKSKLHNAPSRNSNQESNVIIAFPNTQGQLQNFRIYEASVMHPELAARFPGIDSYVGQGIDDKTATIRFSVTAFGLHTMTFSGIDGTSFIDPYSKDLKNYMVFNKANLATTKTFRCDVVSNNDLAENIDENSPLLRASNSLFKTYRLALACTIEYAAFHVAAAGMTGGTLTQKKAAVLAAMVVTMTRVNGVYEKDMSLTMVLIPNNDAIINITSDNYDNNNANNVLLDQNQVEIDATIGSANYDIGHVASTGGGGVASPQGPCNATNKARGVTGLPSPVGDEYDIDFVAHEMGHQFGCSHTFNGDAGNCGGGNRVTASAFEPGSGTTIMGYAGICAPQDVQLHSDAYFHARSLIQMMAYVNAGGNCAVAVANNNNPPVITAVPTYTIPVGTPFVLRGVATDADPTASLTYCWEQYNFQISTQPPVATSTVGPNFRSYNPTASPDRYFPKLSDILANNLAPTWEVIPTVARAMVFSLVVRDNQVPNGGQTQRVTGTVNFVNAGPLKVTSQNGIEAWAQNSSHNVTWDVNGTDANGINATMVNIRLSIDGGLTYPYMLAQNTPNDGIESIVAPDVVSQTCRVMVEAVGNIFFALNTTNFYIGYQITNTCNTYTYNTPFAVPDGVNSYTVRQINVPTHGVMSDVNITVNATHPNLQNLVIGAIRPSGTLATLFSQQCAGNADLNVTFDGQGSAFTCASPTTGTYLPATAYNMNNFNGFDAFGNWQFGFKDVVAGNAGTINSITLNVCTQTVTLASQEFEFENFTLHPNPNNGNFTIQFDSKSGNKINVAVHDMRGRKIFDRSYSNNGLFSENLQLENTQAGIYLVSVQDGNKKIVKRIVIQ